MRLQVCNDNIRIALPRLDFPKIKEDILPLLSNLSSYSFSQIFSLFIEDKNECYLSAFNIDSQVILMIRIEELGCYCCNRFVQIEYAHYYYNIHQGLAMLRHFCCLIIIVLVSFIRY